MTEVATSLTHLKKILKIPGSELFHPRGIMYKFSNCIAAESGDFSVPTQYVKHIKNNSEIGVRYLRLSS